MNTYLERAKAKLDEEAKKGCTSNKAKAILAAVVDALKVFAEQEAEFAQAIVQTDKTVCDCCEEMAKGIGSSISDIEVYRKAVEFYFAGADIIFEMKINLCASVEPQKTIVIDITDFC